MCKSRRALKAACKASTRGTRALTEAKRAAKIAHRRGIERGQLHRPIFGEHRQRRSARRGLLDPAGELGFIGRPIGQAVDRILRGGDGEAGHSARIQYCIGLGLSPVLAVLAPR